jgi:hypothetical protein
MVLDCFFKDAVEAIQRCYPLMEIAFGIIPSVECGKMQYKFLVMTRCIEIDLVLQLTRLQGDQQGFFVGDLQVELGFSMMCL